jgi:DNA-binding MarR family transcriptional regulator
METTTPLPSLDSDFGWALRAISISFRTEASEAVAHLPSGERGYLVLLAASEHSGQSQLAIARRLGVDKTVMTYLVDALVDKGLIVREPDPHDRRVRTLVLTDDGRASLDAARAHIAAAENRLLAPLSSADAERFRTLLAAVAASTASAGSSVDTDCGTP